MNSASLNRGCKQGWLLMVIFFTTLLMPLAMPTASAGASLFVSAADEDEFLPPDQAFKLSLKAVDSQTLQASFSVAPGHYLYRERIKFEVATPVSISSVELPPGESKQDPTFGQTEVYHHDLIATVRLGNVSQWPLQVTATYQGCSEKGLCYAPITKVVAVAATGSVVSAASNSASNLAGTPAGSDSQIANLLRDGEFWLIVAGFFGFGLLLSFTPCVLPMIPILSGIIVGSQSTLKRLTGFKLSLAYVLGMALSYTLVGIAAGLSGQLLSNFLQNIWFIGASALIFVLLALAMFGFYELQLPQALQQRMLQTSNRLPGGRLLGVFAMGVLSALIVGPCVAAPLAGALLYISQTQDVWLGGAALFAMSLGMGVPLLLIGTSAGVLLPKAGAWMQAVRHFFGVLLLAVALWLIGPFLPMPLQLGLWAALLIVVAIYLRALDSLPAGGSPWHVLWKGIGVLLLLLGAAMLVGALTGGRSPLQPLSGLSLAGKNSSQAAHASLPFQRIRTVQELQQRLADTQQPVMLDFYADWCVACKELELYTFSDSRVQQALQGVLLLQVDMTANNADDQALLKRYGLFGPPAMLFFDRDGRALPALNTIGFETADRFLNIVQQLPR